jgi:hypothetical protein
MKYKIVSILILLTLKHHLQIIKFRGFHVWPMSNFMLAWWLSCIHTLLIIKSVVRKLTLIASNSFLKQITVCFKVIFIREVLWGTQYIENMNGSLINILTVSETIIKAIDILHIAKLMYEVHKYQNILSPNF